MRYRRLIFNLIRLILILALVSVLGAACTPAQVREMMTGQGGVHYLAPDRGLFPQFPGPPPPGSAVDRADLQVLLTWQERRTPADCARAGAESFGNFENLMGGLIPFSRPLPPEVEAFFKRVHGDLDYAVGAVKERFRRPRPFLRDARLDPSLGRIGGFSYPSGHAANARLFALILADLAPARREAFLARADEAALNRVVGGVHHPSDIEAGKRLAGEIYDEICRNPVFRRDLRSIERYLPGS